jgi:hypothetical protein
MGDVRVDLRQEIHAGLQRWVGDRKEELCANLQISDQRVAVEALVRSEDGQRGRRGRMLETCHR